MTSSNLRISGRKWAVAAAILLGSMVTAEVSRAETRILVANFTSFTAKELSDYLTENLKPEIKNEIIRRKLVVFALTAKFDEKQACIAMVGLTEGIINRNPRLPAARYPRIGKEDDKHWAEGNCTSVHLKAAIEDLNKAGLTELLEGIDFTASEGGKRSMQKQSLEMMTLATPGIATEYQQSLYDVIGQHKFSSAFDYRHVQSSIYATAAQFNNESYICVAFAGVSGNSPENRNFRWPGYTTSFVRMQSGGNIDACKNFVAKTALTNLLDEPWTEKGLLDNFAASREDGLPLPRAQKDKPQQREPAATTSTTRQSNRTSCTNDCMNGSCARKFPDGTTERWQAPRKFDPLSQNWGWDTSTNACGL
jgi:hypothetical protein